MAKSTKKCDRCKSKLDSEGFCTEDECENSAEYFSGAICSSCDSELDNRGYCTNEECGQAECRQDEVPDE